MFGRDARLPFDPPSSTAQLPVTNDYHSQLTRFLNKARSSARERIRQQQNLYKRHFDTGRSDLPPLQAGRLVLLRQMMPKHLRKFSPKYYGPFQVILQLSRLNYEVKRVHDGHCETVHVSRIRLLP